jgi:hypothetical protein
MYISFGIRAAPQQTQTILQEYMYNFRQLSMGFLHHIGFSLAVDISANAQQPKEVVKGKGMMSITIRRFYVNMYIFLYFFSGSSNTAKLRY